MKAKRIIGFLSAISMIITASAPVYAKDAVEYENEGINFAIIANEAEINGSAKIHGGIYAEEIDLNGIGAFNQTKGIDGVVVASEMDGMKNMPEDQIIYDKNTQELKCKVSKIEIPDIKNNYAGGIISSDTYIKVDKNFNEDIIIDATENDVTIVLKNGIKSIKNLNVTIEGDYQVNFYIDAEDEDLDLGDFRFNSGKAESKNGKELEEINSNMDLMGDFANVNLYLKSDDSVKFSSKTIISANMFIEAEEVDVQSSILNGVIAVYAEDLKIPSNANIKAQICAPESEVKITGSAFIIGQIHADDIEVDGSAEIYFGDWEGNGSDQDNPNTPDPEQPIKPDDGSGSAGDGIGESNFAYIFGYEPQFIERYDENGEADGQTVVIEMAPDDNATREQVCAMIMRLVEQEKGYTGGGQISPYIINVSDWASKGVEYICSTGAYDDLEYNLAGTGDISRGEVAKLVVYGLGLELKGASKVFSDINGTNKYKPYIDIMTSNGYMQGDGDTFRSDAFMTRAEFCSMFNYITGRSDNELLGYDNDGNLIEIVPQMYYIIDLDDVDEWKRRECMLATSAFNSDGTVDLETRSNNIRNVVDEYDAQKEY